MPIEYMTNTNTKAALQAKEHYLRDKARRRNLRITKSRTTGYYWVIDFNNMGLEESPDIERINAYLDRFLTVREMKAAGYGEFLAIKRK